MTFYLRLVCFAALGLALPCTAAYAQLFTYTFDDVTTDSASSAGGTAGGAVFSDFTASGIGGDSTAGGVFSFSGWTTGATSGSDAFAGALDLGDYFQFSITPVSGYSLTLSSIAFDAGRSPTGPRQFTLRSSIDGFVANLAGSATDAAVTVNGDDVFQFADNTATAIYGGNSVGLDGADYLGLTNPVTFRVYAFNAESSLGTFRVDNLSIHGSASAVPEPATYAAWSALAALLGVMLHRRRARRNG